MSVPRKIIRFETGSFTVEVYGHTEQEAIERLGSVLAGNCVAYAGEITWDHLSIADMKDRLQREAIKPQEAK